MSMGSSPPAKPKMTDSVPILKGRFWISGWTNTQLCRAVAFGLSLVVIGLGFCVLLGHIISRNEHHFLTRLHIHSNHTVPLTALIFVAVGISLAFWIGWFRYRRRS